MARTLIFAGLALGILATVPALAADDGGASPDELAVQAIRAFERRLAGGEPDRAPAVRELAAMDHPFVARRLVRLACSEADYELRAEALRALPLQSASTSLVVSRVVKLVDAEAKFKRRALIEIELDLNNDVVLDTPEAKACIARIVARDGMREAAVRCLLSIGCWDGLRSEALTALLESGHDGLATAVLETFATRGDWRALPKILALYEIYPSPYRWTTSHIVFRDAKNDTKSKMIYLARFGDPNFFRARPAVVGAIRETLPAITGRTFDTPAELRAFLGRSEVKRRMKRPPQAVERARR